MKTPKVHRKTSSLEVLGITGSNNLPGKWSEHHQRLTELREQFLRGRNSQTLTAKEELCWFSEHMADAATDSYDRDCALALLSSTQNALYEIDQALRRIQEGTYGICELTGGRIQSARLKAIPWTRFSVEAQEKIEAGRGGPRVKLGQVGSLIAFESDQSQDESEEESAGRQAEKEAA